MSLDVAYIASVFHIFLKLLFLFLQFSKGINNDSEQSLLENNIHNNKESKCKDDEHVVLCFSVVALSLQEIANTSLNSKAPMQSC